MATRMRHWNQCPGHFKAHMVGGLGRHRIGLFVEADHDIDQKAQHEECDNSDNDEEVLVMEPVDIISNRCGWILQTQLPGFRNARCSQRRGGQQGCQPGLKQMSSSWSLVPLSFFISRLRPEMRTLAPFPDALFFALRTTLMTQSQPQPDAAKRLAAASFGQAPDFCLISLGIAECHVNACQPVERGGYERPSTYANKDTSDRENQHFLPQPSPWLGLVAFVTLCIMPQEGDAGKTDA